MLSFCQMNKHLAKRTINLAKAMCPLNLERRTSHIAFLIKKSKIVHIGFNLAKSHPITKNYKYQEHQHTGVHAELNACIKSGKENLNKYKLIVIRINRSNTITNSKPCIGCQGIIKQFNVGQVWYSTDKGNFEQLN
jgi:deoxycytidylate deaminase